MMNEIFLTYAFLKDEMNLEDSLITCYNSLKWHGMCSISVFRPSKCILNVIRNGY